MNAPVVSNHPVWRWERIATTLRDGRGPERVYDESGADPDWTPRPAGFTATLPAKAPVAEPLLWEGDGS